MTCEIGHKAAKTLKARHVKNADAEVVADRGTHNVQDGDYSTGDGGGLGDSQNANIQQAGMGSNQQSNI